MRDVAKRRRGLR